ncbi:MAG TPA: OmpA family protein [Hyphomicrobium sp.]|nr:OmpA family protein [Hyphomicrobium sp.]
MNAARARQLRTSKPYRHAALALSVAVSVIALGSGMAMSQSPNVPTAESIVEALKSKGPARGLAANPNASLIAALKQKSSRGISISQEERSKLADAVKDLPVQDMEIPFELNSASIAPSARPNIEALGKALQDAQLKGVSFLLAGHTDATGSAPYNQTLSERRAQTVRKLLIDEFKLTNDQFIAVGYGPERLKNPQSPRSSENRRVQIVNLGE